MKIKTAELTGKALDWALAKALKKTPALNFKRDVCVSEIMGWQPFSHTDPATCLGLIERHMIDVTYEPRHKDCPMWVARMPRWGLNYGSTPAEAVARCVVQMQLGDEVEVPSELVGEKS